MKRLKEFLSRTLEFLVPGAHFLRRRNILVGAPLLVVTLAFASALTTYYATDRRSLSPIGDWYSFDPRGAFMGQSLETGEDLIALNVRARAHSVTRVSPIWPEDEQTIHTGMNGSSRRYHFGFVALLLANGLLLGFLRRRGR